MQSNLKYLGEYYGGIEGTIFLVYNWLSNAINNTFLDLIRGSDSLRYDVCGYLILALVSEWKILAEQKSNKDTDQ